MYYILQHFWHKRYEEDWTLVLGIRFSIFFKIVTSILLFWRREEIYRKKLTDCVSVLLAWLITMHCLLERFLKDHWCLMPYFHQTFSVIWILCTIQFSQIIFCPSNCISGNSYSLIVFQNYSEVLVVLTQGFPLMRSNIFWKFLLLTVSRMINHFVF